jgi:WXXGXW repeat (2 copies)
MTFRSAVRFVSYAVVLAALCATMFGQVGVAISFAPPPIPVYEQPLCPGDGYLWVPGYWAYGDDFDDYYWVPGTWVLPPDAGLLWTPPYWGWNGAGFVFYDGYWGPTIGFYGGINYGFGYFGNGFVGGRWEGGRFFYNRAVMNINVTNIHNVYETRVTNITENRVSYNGGNGGISVRPTAQEEAAARQHHVPAVQAQMQQIQAARGDEQLRASVNRGKPPVAATPKPGALGDHPVAAQEAGGSYTPHQSRPVAASNSAERRNENAGHQAIHPNDLSPVQRPPAPNTGNTKLDQKYQKQQEKMVATQEKERQKLQKQQDKEHQKLEKQQANDAKKQQVEQRHQQQTAKMQQRQSQQMQHMQERQAPAMHAAGARPPKE